MTLPPSLSILSPKPVSAETSALTFSINNSIENQIQVSCAPTGSKTSSLPSSNSSPMLTSNITPPTATFISNDLSVGGNNDKLPHASPNPILSPSSSMSSPDISLISVSISNDLLVNEINHEPTGSQFNTTTPALSNNSFLGAGNSQTGPTTSTPVSSRNKVSEPKRLNFYTALIGLDSDSAYNPERIRSVLRRTLEGKSVLSYYRDKKSLLNSKRKILCRAMIDEELKDDTEENISSNRFKDMAQAIVDLFPTEILATWYVARYRDSTNKVHKARGKLYDRWINLRRSFEAEDLVLRKENRHSNIDTGTYF